MAEGEEVKARSPGEAAGSRAQPLAGAATKARPLEAAEGLGAEGELRPLEAAEAAVDRARPLKEAEAACQ